MLNEHEHEPCGAVDQEAFDNAIRENLSPAGVASIIAFLQPAFSYKSPTEEGRQALREVEWFHNTLVDLIGVDECNRLFDELGL